MGAVAATTVPFATAPSASRPVRGVIVRDPDNGGSAGPADWRGADDLGGNTMLGLARGGDRGARGPRTDGAHRSLGEERTFRWRAGDVFVPPLGVWHQHVSEAKPWDLTRLLIVRNTGLEHAFGIRPGHVGTRVPDRLPAMLEPDYGTGAGAAVDVRTSLASDA